MQRCTFHAFCQVKKRTTRRPKTQAGVDLYAITKGLARAGSLQASAERLAAFHGWCADYEGFLRERSDDGKRYSYKHDRLRKVREWRMIAARANGNDMGALARWGGWRGQSSIAAPSIFMRLIRPQARFSAYMPGRRDYRE